ncbi:hypothetical protein E1B28_008549 [Marasmius oreades]|uniref:Uncharacterized protein n=1 Tax=Marasmius oreades TaxID=181124 RepID=A0A9P7USH6_9AGAR|nr:uncharacterized protein E1B28_008549 [Marasmius oreades]KAG7092180.1 hypothetical protein E1B28_008549 [Marasmius oreades]
MPQSSSQKSPTTAASPTMAMTSNATVFKQMSNNMKTPQYPAVVEKLARWLNDDRAYYDAARGPIVQLLQLAHDQLKIALGLDPATPLNAQLHAHAWVPCYINLFQIVLKHVRHFKEPYLRERALRLVNTILSDAHAPPTQMEIIDVDAEETAPSVSPTNVQSQVKHNPGPISAVFPRSNPVSSASNTIASTTTFQSVPSSSRDYQYEEKPKDNCSTSLNLGISIIPNELSPATTNDRLLSEARFTSEPASNKLPSVTSPRSKLKVEDGLVKSYMEANPVSAATDRREISPVRSDDRNHSSAERTVQPPPPEQNLPTFSEVQSSLASARAEGTALSQKPQFQPASMIVIENTRMDVDDVSIAQSDRDIDITRDEKPHRVPPNDQGVNMSDVQCDTNDEMEVDAQLTSTEIVPSEGVVTEGISESAISQSGSKELGYVAAAQEMSRRDVSQEKDMEPARTPISCQLIPDVVSVSSLTPEQGEKRTAEKATFVAYSGSGDVVPVQDTQHSVPLPNSISLALPGLKQPRIYYPAIDGFNSTMKVIAFHASPAYGSVDFTIKLQEDQLQNIMTWNRRNQLKRLQGPIHKSSTCLSLACYSAKDIQRMMQLASESEVTKIGYQFFNKIRSVFPTNDTLQMYITRSSGKTQKILLSPPLFTLLTPDGHIDLGVHVRWPFNKIRLHRSRRGVEGDFVFVLHAHSPTRAQLQQLEKRTKDDVDWENWLSHFSRPFDLSSNPFARLP